MLESGTTPAAEAAHGHAEAPMDTGAEILHHIVDHEYEWGKLPEVFGIDISITKHVVMMWIASALLLVLFSIAVRRSKGHVPRGGLRNALEVLVLFVRDEVARKAIGKDGDKFLGYLLTTFFFILTCNFLGLIPGSATATGNINVTAGLALIAFIVIQMAGILRFGLIKHIRHLSPGGVPIWMVPIMMALEGLGMLIKPFALCIRLFANMMAGHIVILAFISLIFILSDVWFVVAPVAVGFALFVNLLEILVATIQAFIFTMLTAQFIGMSVHPH